MISWALGFALALPVPPAQRRDRHGFPGDALRYVLDGRRADRLGVTVVLCILASFVPAYRASRMSVAEVLVYE